MVILCSCACNSLQGIASISALSHCRSILQCTMYIHVHVMSEKGLAMGEMKRYQVEILLALIQCIVNYSFTSEPGFQI